MRCNHTMTFPQELVWQYGGPSQQSGNERQIPPDAHPKASWAIPARSAITRTPLWRLAVPLSRLL
jgi:hypothetical protein